jgi:alpha-tubulin suppressor-like RCC1 family protein
MIGAAHLMMRGASGPVQPKGLFATGYNYWGELGIGNQLSKTSFVQVGSGTDWVYVTEGRPYSGDAASLAIKSNGSLWALGGYNYDGQLGLGDQNPRSSPVQIGSLLDWASVETGSADVYYGGVSSMILAIKTDGSLWAWGNNGDGVLALGDSISRSSPVQVGSLKNWKQVSASKGGKAIKTDGSLWVWGWNQNGELGLGDRTIRSSPVQVGSGLDWKSVVSCNQYHVAAIKTGGTLWTWGQNAYGQLGLGDRTNRSSPVQVGSDTDWAEVACAENSMVAIKTGGTLWAWGLNDNGVLGLGDRTKRSSPVQVGSDTNWAKVGCGDNGGGCVRALKTNGTLWGWGQNGHGQLGLGGTTSFSSPVQVGSGTNWTKIVSKNQGSGLSAFAIRT